MSPDLILANALVLSCTGDGRPEGHQTSLAVKDGLIAAIGGDELIDTATTSTRLVDLEGRSLAPGINDGHLHVGGFASGRSPAALDLSPGSVGSIADIVAALAAKVAETPTGQWIRGRGWVRTALSDLDGEPTAELIDHVSPRNPVVFTDFSGHALWANTAAMRGAGLTRSTPVPVGGVVRRDSEGEFTGLFMESAEGMVADHLPPLSDEELEAAIRSALAEFHRQGITSITDASLNPLHGYEDHLGGHRVFEILERICGPDDVALRTQVLLNFSPLGSSLLQPTIDGLNTYGGSNADPSWFNIRGLKIFADGVPANCTSWMNKSYPTGDHGCLTVGGDTDDDRVEELGLIIKAGHDAGLQVGVHVTGDRATDAVVDGFGATLADSRRVDPRHYIIHGPLISETQLDRITSLGVGINVQPSLKSVSAQMIEGMFGRELSEYQWPLRSILNSGCVMASSSDAPVTTPNWRAGVGTAMLREALSGEVYGEDQRIDVDEALRSYTAAGAWQDAAETWKGTLEVGKVADLCVIDGRLSTDDPHDFAGMDVSMTVVGGAIVHGDG